MGRFEIGSFIIIFYHEKHEGLKDKELKFDKLVKSHFSGHFEECNDEAI